MATPKRCWVCKTAFIGDHNQRYCTPECRIMARRQRERDHYWANPEHYRQKSKEEIQRSLQRDPARQLWKWRQRYERAECRKQGDALAAEMKRLLLAFKRKRDPRMATTPKEFL